MLINKQTRKSMSFLGKPAVESCLALLSDGGGRVVVKYVDDFASAREAFHESWIVEHHQISMITLELPAHGCLSLIAPLNIGNESATTFALWRMLNG